jgi:uncharacterized repeat protein (TIGR03806 family)
VSVRGGRWASLALAAVVLSGTLGACGDDQDPASRDPRVPPVGDASPDVAPVSPADAGTDAAPVHADFGLDTRPTNTTCKAPARPPAGAPVKLVPAFPNLTLPYATVALAQPPGDKSRWFGVTLDGRIFSFPTASPPETATIIADLGVLTGLTVLESSEAGLLDLAFHPKFAQNGQLFLSWNTDGGPADLRSLVSRITTTDGGATFGQHTIILGPFEQPAANHNGGTAKFGPDGLLYLSFGDGGGVGGIGRGRSVDGFFSKILRIDVDNPAPGQMYGIPAGNPFKNGGGEPATFARGFRNPFRFSFDRATGDLWVGDVGEADWEEVDIVKPGGDHGWPCREGRHDYTPLACTGADSLVEPIFDYSHAGAPAAITGGVVYRGAAIGDFTGAYVFGDSSTSDAFALTFDPTTGAPVSTLLNPTTPRENWVQFTEDADGEIYALGFSGAVYKVVAAQPAPASTFPDRLSKTGCVDAADPKRPAPGVIPYGVNVPFWSDGADKERFLALPDGKTIAVGADGDFDLPIGSVLMKTFSIGNERIETRLFVRHDDGEWAGYSYEWNDAQTDATLLPSSKSKNVGAQTWSFPSRGQCIGCHTTAAGHTLGLELGQLNGDLLYASTNRISNQLRTLEHIGMLGAPLGKPVTQLVAFPATNSTGPLEPRARAYLHANCAQCHRPTGPGGGGLDLRFGASLADTKACGTVPQRGELGVAGAKVITPGSTATSVLSLRPHSLGAARMPPIASSVVDSAGLSVLDDWIRGIAACP